MERSSTTKLNDAVTQRQFERFLPNAKLPARWMGKVNTLNDVLLLQIMVPVSNQIFIYWGLID